MLPFFQKLYHQKVLQHATVLIAVYFLLQIPLSCKKETITTPLLPVFDSIMDVDSNYYRIVKIGEQWWMAENLEVKSYNDGSPIRNAASDDFWKDTLPGYCLYKNDESAPGLLYNWYAVNSSKRIAPAGWHIATEEDWQKLETYLGMPQYDLARVGWRGTLEGSKLKIDGKKGWLTEVENWPTNESGFTALAGSCRKQNGVWGEPGLTQTGFWWTATEENTGKAFYRYLDYKNTKVFRHQDYKNCGLSVRCVKD
jgi:uncharacterized protein (TIGR02145 family)